LTRAKVYRFTELYYTFTRAVLAAIKIETVLAALVILNLIGLTIAAYRIMKKK
jgi:hypothetical protein